MMMLMSCVAYIPNTNVPRVLVAHLDVDNRHQDEAEHGGLVSNVAIWNCNQPTKPTNKQIKKKARTSMRTQSHTINQPIQNETVRTIA
jgi:hypothetical protein